MAYIDRDKLLKDIEESVIFTVSKGQKYFPEIRGANKVIDRIKQSPIADVVEVVRCEKCAYKDIITCPINGIKTIFCTHAIKPVAVQPTHYCSYGKRKEVEKQ